MSWKHAGFVFGFVALGNIAGLLWSQGARLGLWIVVGTAAMAAGYLAIRRSQRRIDSVITAPVEERAKRLAILNAEEQALARLALQTVSPDKVLRLPVEGEVFGYDRTPRSLVTLLFWIFIVGSVLPLSCVVVGVVPRDQGIATFLMGGLCAGFALLMHAIEGARGRIVIVTPFGLVHRTPAGSRVGILWSEIAWIRERRGLMVLEIHAADGRRRIRVSYSLTRFPEFAELLASALIARNAAAAADEGPSDNIPEPPST